MALSKEQLRKMYGVTEPTGPSDPEVLARRGKHEAAAKWCAKWCDELMYASMLAGFLVVLLPSMWSAWGRIIANMPLLSTLSYDYSHFRSISKVQFFVTALLYTIFSFLSSHEPQGNLKISNYSYIVIMELYPTTVKSEWAFYMGMINRVSIGPLFFPIFFGYIAFIFNN